jgi:hypothetical protein
MNGSPQLPQYTFDPATQQYRLKTPAEQAQEQQRGRSGLGALYDSGGSPTSGPTSSVSMSPETAVGLQNFSLAVQGVPSIAAQIAGLVAGAVPAAFGYAVPSPVANPNLIAVTAIDPVDTTPTDTLADMNEASSGSDDDGTPEGDVSVGPASTEGFGEEGGPTSAADAGFGTADDAADAAAAGDAAAAAGDAGADGGGGGDGGGGDGGGGAGGGAGGAGGGAGGGASGDLREGGMIRQRNYKAGGLASAAQHVQDQGRKGDSMLVHMSPDEVRGLQAIAMQHGGSLTINPRTGLVEANFLKSILPVVAGAALAPFTGGASMAALLVGGGTALMTGSLERGLMAGLGAFGGASLAGSLSAASGASTAGQVMTPQMAQAATVTPQTVAGPAVSNVYPQEFMRGTAASFVDPTIATGATPTAAQIAASPAGIARVTPITYENMGTGFKALGSEQGRNLFMQDIGGATGLATKVVAPIAAGSMFSAEEPDTGGKTQQEYIRPYSFDFNRADVDPEFRYRTGEKGESTAEQRYFTPTFTPMGVFKGGTEPGPSFYGTPTQEQLALYSAPRSNVSSTAGRIRPGILGLAAGGVAGLGKGGLKDGAFIVPADVVAHLGNGSNDAGQKLLARGLGARPIKGKGDGMSDSIPTSIEGRQPALVADGEAYIPPEVVKKVGSKRLYNMMAKIRQARTGTKKQAPEVDPRKFMPA